MSRLTEELPRKAVHIGIGACALLLRWLEPWQAALVAAVALLFNLFVLHPITGRRLLRDGERRSGFSMGIALYPAVVLALVLVFRERLELAAAVWGLLALGDGMAGITGLLAGGPRLPWNPGKTWSGLLGFVLYGTAASAFLIRWTQQAIVDGGGAAGAHVGASFLATTPGGGMSEATWLILGCGLAALAAGLAESLDSGVDDNLMVPAVGGLALFALTAVEPSAFVAAAGTLQQRVLPALAINGLLALLALAARSVSVSGAVWGTVLGSTLYVLAGWRGFLMLLAFFVLGTLTTKLGWTRKASLGIAQERGGRRGARNAFANTGAGVIFAALALGTPNPAVCLAGLVAAFATATCDTVSSEIGQAYGKRHFLVTNFRRVAAGTDGAVSVEGTLAGIAGAALVALLAGSVGLIPWSHVWIVTFAAFFGATLESYLGATVEGLHRIDNELVNFTNTVVGGLVAAALVALVGSG